MPLFSTYIPTVVAPSAAGPDALVAATTAAPSSTPTPSSPGSTNTNTTTTATAGLPVCGTQSLFLLHAAGGNCAVATAATAPSPSPGAGNDATATGTGTGYQGSSNTIQLG